MSIYCIIGALSAFGGYLLAHKDEEVKGRIHIFDPNNPAPLGKIVVTQCQFASRVKGVENVILVDNNADMVKVKETLNRTLN